MENNQKKENAREQQEPPQNIFYPNYGYPYPPPPPPQPQPEYGPPPPAVSDTEGFAAFEPSYQQTPVLNQQQQEAQGLSSQLAPPAATQGGGTKQPTTGAFNSYLTMPIAAQTRMTPSVQSLHGQPYGQHFQPQFYDLTPVNQSLNPLARHHPPNDKPFAAYGHQHLQTAADPNNFYGGNNTRNFRAPPPNVRFNPYKQYGYARNASSFTPPSSYPPNYQTTPVNLVVNPPVSAAATSQPPGSNTGFHYNACDYERRENLDVHAQFQQHSRHESYELASAGSAPYMPQAKTNIAHRQLSNGVNTPSTSGPRFMGPAQHTDQPAMSQNVMSAATTQPTYTSTNHEGQENQQAANLTNGSIPGGPGFGGLHTSAYRPQAQATSNRMNLNGNQQGYTQMNYDLQPSNATNDPVPSTSGLMGMTCTPQPKSQNGTSTSTQPDYSLTAFNNLQQLQPMNATNDPVPSTSGFMGMSSYTSQPENQNGTMSTSTLPDYSLTALNNQPSGSGVQQLQETSTGMSYSGSGVTERTVNYFTGEGSERGMTATEIITDENEERRRAMTVYEDERLKRLHLTQELKQRFQINPNVKIEARITQELLHQCLQGVTPDQRTMERLYGSVNINSAGQTHNFSNFDVTNSYGGQGFNPDSAPQSLQHSNFMRPPPPYPLSHVDRLAIETARDEARKAEKDLKESQEKRIKVEERIIANEVGKRKMKTRNERMSMNRREGYLRYQYCGRATRNTQSYLQGRDEGLEEFLMQLDLAEARSVEQRAAERMNIANRKLTAYREIGLDEASQLEAAGTHQRPPPAYRQEFNPAPAAPVAPMRQQNNRRGRGRRPQQSCQPASRRSTASSQSYAHSSAAPPPPPPSYPSTSRVQSSRAQQYQAPMQTQNVTTNPPDYYQAVAAARTEFRSQHPRRTASYAPGRRPSVPAQSAPQSLQYPIPTVQSQRKPPTREMPQVAAPVVAPLQNQWAQRSRNYPTAPAAPAAEANPASRVRAQNPQNPAPICTAPAGCPVRQTRSSARSRGDAGVAGPSGLAGVPILPGCSYSPAQMPAQMAPIASGSGTQRRRMPQQRTSNAGVAPAAPTPSDVADSNAESIENIVPTIPAIPNTIFERCLKEIAPEEIKESQSVNEASAVDGGTANTQEPPAAPGPTQPPIETPSASQDQEEIEKITEQELDQLLAEHANTLAGTIDQEDFTCETFDI